MCATYDVSLGTFNVQLFIFNFFRQEPPMILSRRSLFIYTSAAMPNPTQSWLCWLLTQCEKTPRTAVQWSEVLPWGVCALWGTKTKNSRFCLLHRDSLLIWGRGRKMKIGDLTNIRNGKSILKISKWPNLKSLWVKNEIFVTVFKLMYWFTLFYQGPQTWAFIIGISDMLFPSLAFLKLLLSLYYMYIYF